MSNRSNTPSHEEIVKGQALLLQTLSKEVQVNPKQSCWSCGFLYVTSAPVKAHLIALKHGGDNRPQNFILLCQQCHEAQPDGASVDVQLMWLRAGFSARNFELEFFKRTSVPLRSLLGVLQEKHGEKGSSMVLNRALKKGRRMSAGKAKGNAIANTVSVFIDDFYQDIELLKQRQPERATP